MTNNSTHVLDFSSWNQQNLDSDYEPLFIKGAYWAFGGIFVYPCYVENCEQAILVNFSISRKDISLLSQVLASKSSFGTLQSGCKTTTTTDTDVQVFNSRKKFGHERIFSSIAFSTNLSVKNVNGFETLRIGDLQSFEDTSLAISFEKYQNMIGLGKDSVFISNLSIEHPKTVFFDYTQVRSTSIDSSEVYVGLNIDPRDSRLGECSKIKILSDPNSVRQQAGGMALQDFESLSRYIKSHTVVKILSIGVKSVLTGELNRLWHGHLFCILDVYQPHFILPKNIYTECLNELQSGAIQSHVDWRINKIWETGTTHTNSLASSLSDMDESHFPSIVVEFESTTPNKPWILEIPRMNYIKSLAPCEYTYKSNAFPEEKKEAFQETQLNLRYSPFEVELGGYEFCMLGNCAFLGKALLVDYDKNELRVFVK